MKNGRWLLGFMIIAAKWLSRTSHTALCAHQAPDIEAIYCVKNLDNYQSNEQSLAFGSGLHLTLKSD